MSYTVSNTSVNAFIRFINMFEKYFLASMDLGTEE